MEYFQYPRVGRYIPIVELENNNWEVSALVFWPILGDII